MSEAETNLFTFCLTAYVFTMLAFAGFMAWLYVKTDADGEVIATLSAVFGFILFIGGMIAVSGLYSDLSK